jgi:ankyrin repeat protein
LLEKGADPNQEAQIHGSKPALAAAAGESDQRMVELLLNHGDTLNRSGALIFAAKQGKEENVKCLLSRGADVNEIVPLGYSLESKKIMGSALHKALESDQVGVVDILLNAGADKNLKDAKGRTALDIARSKAMDATLLARLS